MVVQKDRDAAGHRLVTTSAQTLQFSNFNINTSSAPASTNASITVAILFLSTILLTATQFSSSSGLIVGAWRPGVIVVHAANTSRLQLYWQMTYFDDAITPAMREVMVEMSGMRLGCLGVDEAMSIAWELRRVAMG